MYQDLAEFLKYDSVQQKEANLESGHNPYSFLSQEFENSPSVSTKKLSKMQRKLIDSQRSQSQMAQHSHVLQEAESNSPYKMGQQMVKVVSPEMFLRNARRDVTSSCVTNGLVKSDQIFGKRSSSINTSAIKNLRRMVTKSDQQKQTGKGQNNMKNSIVQKQLQRKKADAQASQRELITLQDNNLTQIQVTGADLVYLRNHNISKKLLPEILVHQANLNAQQQDNPKQRRHHKNVDIFSESKT